MLEVFAGTAVTVQATFTVGNAPTDPTTITMKFRSGGNTITTWTYGGAGSITRVSTGVYSATLDTTPGTLTVPGIWTVEWTGTGAAAVVQTAQFQVDQPPL